MASKPSTTRIPSTSSPAQPQTQRTRPKKLQNPDHETGGGVMLPPTSASSASKLPATKPTDPKSTDATAPTRRRKPRKLNKDPLPTDPSTASPKPEEAAVGTELEALKSRVRGLEAKVEELYTTGKAGNGKSPRRRGKGRKASTGIDKAAEPEPDTNEPDTNEPETAELERLESELALARLDLATLSTSTRAPRPRPTASRVQSQEEDIEDIPRGNIPSASDPRPQPARSTSSANDRSVTLTGSYRIPLPPSVNIDDVRTIQSGIGAAQNVARSFLDSRRENAAKTGPAQSAARSATPARKGEAAAAGGGEGEGQSWGEWFGAYSMSISRAVKKIEAEAGVEVEAAQGRIAGARRASAPGKGVARKGAGGVAGSGAKATGGSAVKGAAGGRPPLKPRASNSNARMSAEQVKTLMS